MPDRGQYAVGQVAAGSNRLLRQNRNAEPGAQLSAEEVVAHCKARLAGFKVPKSVVFVPALPRNAAGKVEKHRLRSEYGNPA